MKRFILVAGLATLGGCGLSEDKFSEESIRLGCEWLIECFNDPEIYADVDECIADVTDNAGEPDDTCTYDAGAAKDCLDGLDALTCDSDPVSDYPSACNDVYTDCAVDTSDTAE